MQNTSINSVCRYNYKHFIPKTFRYEVYYNTYSSMKDTASSTEYSSVFIVMLGLSGGSYRLLIPVKLGISPRRVFR